MFSRGDSDSLVIDDLALAFQVVQAVCVGVSAGEWQEPWEGNTAGAQRCRCTVRLPLSRSLTFPLAVGIQHLGVSDPLHVAVQVFIQLLALSQLLELSARPGLLSLFCKLTFQGEGGGHSRASCADSLCHVSADLGAKTERDRLTR